MLRNDLHLIQQWVHDNCLILNKNKTTVMHVRPPTKPSQAVKIHFHSDACLHATKIGNICNCKEILIQVQNQKYLGVMIDDAFCWEPHMDSVCKRLRSCAFGLSILKNCVCKKTLIMVYQALAESVVRYGLTAWGSGSSTYLFRIEKLQLALLKIIHKKQNNRTKPNLFKTFNVLPVKELWKISMITNFYFNNEFRIEYPRTHEQRRGADRRYFLVPMHNNKHGENELSVVIPSLFNE